MMAEIFEKTRIENLKIKKENRSYYLPLSKSGL